MATSHGGAQEKARRIAPLQATALWNY